jgi:hypothetical protein
MLSNRRVVLLVVVLAIIIAVLVVALPNIAALVALVVPMLVLFCDSRPCVYAIAGTTSMNLRM